MGPSVPEFALGNPIDIGEPAIRITREVDALNQCQQAVIGAVGDLDRERGLVKSLDVVADKAAQQAAQAAMPWSSETSKRRTVPRTSRGRDRRSCVRPRLAWSGNGNSGLVDRRAEGLSLKRGGRDYSAGEHDPDRRLKRQYPTHLRTRRASPAPRVRKSVQEWWCPWPESNQHSLRNSILSRARLPVPPQGPSVGPSGEGVTKPADYSHGKGGVNPRQSDAGRSRQPHGPGLQA
jgi:hypothetical protein